MKWLALLAGAIALAALAGALWVRLAPSDPARWHVVPGPDTSTGRPNEALRLPGSGAPVYAVPPGELAARLDAVALAEPRTRRLAGGPEAGFTTYVQRSRWLGFPDYVSVQVSPTDQGATLAIWSRARFGRSDLGVNAARLDRWLQALKPLEQP